MFLQPTERRAFPDQKGWAASLTEASINLLFMLKTLRSQQIRRTAQTSAALRLSLGKCLSEEQHMEPSEQKAHSWVNTHVQRLTGHRSLQRCPVMPPLCCGGGGSEPSCKKTASKFTKCLEFTNVSLLFYLPKQMAAACEHMWESGVHYPAQKDVNKHSVSLLLQQPPPLLLWGIQGHFSPFRSVLDGFLVLWLHVESFSVRTFSFHEKLWH